MFRSSDDKRGGQRARNPARIGQSVFLETTAQISCNQRFLVFGERKGKFSHGIVDKCFIETRAERACKSILSPLLW